VIAFGVSRRQKNPLRALTDDERRSLERTSRSHSTPAALVARAKSLLSVADGSRFTDAARTAGRRSGDGVAKLVARFNRLGLAALEAAPSGRPALTYGPAERERILETVRQAPDRELDGTATWSLTTLRSSLRRQPGFERISTHTIHSTLRGAGLSWQRSQTWCQTGTATRKRKAGNVVVNDPDTEPKKS